MDKLAFMTGYFEFRKMAAAVTLPETAAKVTSEPELLRFLAKGVGYPAVFLGLPTAAGYMGGRLYGKMQEPHSKVLDEIQAEYVKNKLEQSMLDLELKRKMEKLKGANVPNTSTLRF